MVHIVIEKMKDMCVYILYKVEFGMQKFKYVYFNLDECKMTLYSN